MGTSRTKYACFSVCAGAALLLLPIIAGTEFTAGGACPKGCSDACKSHNRWCIGAKGYYYDRNVILNGATCSEAPTPGIPVENDTAAWIRWTTCTADCVGINDSTGAPGGEQEMNDVVVLKTRCAPIVKNDDL